MTLSQVTFIRDALYLRAAIRDARTNEIKQIARAKLVAMFAAKLRKGVKS